MSTHPSAVVDTWCREPVGFHPGVSTFIGSVHSLAREIEARFAGVKAVSIYVYGATAVGELVAEILRQYHLLRVRAVLDRRVLAQACLSDAEVIVCYTSPLECEEALQSLGAKAHGSAFYAIYDRPLKTETAGRVPAVIATATRCGTNWLRLMLGFLTRGNGYSEVSATWRNGAESIVDLNIFRKLQPGEYSVYHFVITPELSVAASRGDVKLVYLYRDPRDIQVSTAYINDGFFTFNEAVLKQKVGQILEWRRSNAYLIRYEDMIADTFAVMKGLCDYLELKVGASFLDEVIGFCSFENLSGGRKIGEESATHHYRKGIRGDWKNHYSPELSARVRRCYGDALRSIGYE